MNKLFTSLFCIVTIVACDKTMTEHERLIDRIETFSKWHSGLSGKAFGYDVVFEYNLNEPSPSDTAAYKRNLQKLAVEAKQYIIMDGAITWEQLYTFYFVCTFSDGKRYEFKFFD